MGWIDAAKGIGILLVVYGHAIDGLTSAGLAAPGSVLGTNFYTIYTFHMPLFFFLSGLLVERRVLRDRGAFIARLLPSIVWPYLLWSILQLSIIRLAGNYVNNPLTGFSAKTYLSVLWNPPSQFWFLYTLLVFHLIAAAMIRKSAAPIPLLLLGAALFPLPELTGVDQRLFVFVTHFFLFYALGVCLGSRLAMVRDIAASWACAAAALPIFILSVAFATAHGVFYWSAAAFPAAIAGTLLILFLAVRLHGRPARWLEYLGQRAMAIYILHILFIAGSRIAITRLTGLADPVALALLLTCVGVAFPLAFATLADRLGWSEKLGLGVTVRPPRQPAYG